MQDISKLEKSLMEKGLKLTRTRRLIIQEFLDLHGWISAQELFARVSARNSRVNFSTIYRNLDSFSQLGILCKLWDKSRGINYYTLNKEEHHHHLICKSCGKISRIDYCPLRDIDNDIMQEFSDLECKFEVYGYCKDCQVKNDNS